MTKPYDFVSYLGCREYRKKGTMEGKIPIAVKTLTPIHISSGRYGVTNNKTIYKEFVKVNNEIIIPATSFKGCIRNIAESISHSCLTEDSRNRKIDRKKLPNNRWHVNNTNCIVCNMFGSMGYKSKIQFSDLKSKGHKIEIKGIPESFEPRPDTSYYFNDKGKYKGYKFYKHGINGIQPTGAILYEFVLPGAVFEGEIIFRNLEKTQLQLLCFSLGLSGDINPKIGYAKQYFYGSIEVSSEDKWVGLAKEYKNIGDRDIRENINSLMDILSFDNAIDSLDETDEI